MNITRSKLTAFIVAFVMLFAVIFSISVTPPRTVFADSDYGTIVENWDGSAVTLNFGDNSITGGSGEVSSNFNTYFTSLKYTDNLACSNGSATLTLPSIDLSEYDLNYVQVYVGCNNTTTYPSISVKVGDTEVASISEVYTGGWSTYKWFTAELTNTTASGNVTLNISGSGYCGNYLFVKFGSTGSAYLNPFDFVGSYSGGRQATADTDTYYFNSDVSGSVKKTFASPDDSTKLGTYDTIAYTSYYGNCDSSGTLINESSKGDAVASVYLDKGVYNLYILTASSNFDVNVQIDSGGTRSAATTYADSVTLSKDTATAFATGETNSKALYVRTGKLNLTEDVSGATLRLYNDSYWTPDIYEVILVPIESTIQIPYTEFAATNSQAYTTNTTYEIPYTFTSDIDSEPIIKTLLGGSLTATTTAENDNYLVDGYRNYIGYTGNYVNPVYSDLYLDAGEYTIYYIARTNNASDETVSFAIGSDDYSTATSGTSMTYVGKIANSVNYDEASGSGSSNYYKRYLTLYKAAYTTDTALNGVNLAFIKYNGYLPDLCAAVIVKNPGFGESGFDSGVYTDSTETTYGVIRYLQQYTGTDELEDYGFYFIKSDGSIITDNYISSNEDLDETTYGGFYGDLYGIESSNYGSESSPIYAKPYVTISDSSTTLFGDSIGGYVQDKTVDYTPGE